ERFLPIFIGERAKYFLRDRRQSLNVGIRTPGCHLRCPSAGMAALTEDGGRFGIAKRVEFLERQMIFPHTLNRLTPPSGKILRRTCVTDPAFFNWDAKRCRLWGRSFVVLRSSFHVTASIFSGSIVPSGARQASIEQVSG